MNRQPPRHQVLPGSPWAGDPHASPSRSWQRVPRHKPPILLIAAIAVVWVGLGLWAATRTPAAEKEAIDRGHVTEAQAAAVRVGMGSADVVGLLGRPDLMADGSGRPVQSTDGVGPRVSWYYSTTTGGRLGIAYYEGRVNAAALNDAEGHRVFAIASPDAGVEVR